MIRLTVTLLVLSASLAAAIGSPPTVLEVDFESADYKSRLQAKEAEIATPGCQSDKCLRLRAKGKYASIRFKIDEAIPLGAVLAFDYRHTAETGKLNYLGLNVYTAGGKQTFTSFPTPQENWRHVEIEMAKIRTSTGSKVQGNLQPGDKMTRLSIYGRATNEAADSTAQTVHLDNVRIYVPADFDPAAARAAAEAARHKETHLNTETPSSRCVQPRPADGAEAPLNPPALVWPDDDRVAAWRLELSPRADFSSGVIAYDGIALNFFNGPETLAEGKWYWRYNGTTAEGKTFPYAPVKSFVITERSQPFPVPPFERIIREMPEHPRLFVTPDTLDAFRARSQGPARVAWENVRDRAKEHLDRSVPTFNLAPYTAPNAARGTIVMIEDGKYWHAKGLDERAYNAASGYARDLAYAYLISGEAKYADAAARWIDYLASLRIDPLKEDRSSHDTVVYAIEFGTKNLALAYDHAYDRLSPETRRRVVEALEFQLEAAMEWVRDELKLDVRYLNSHGQQCMHMTFTAVLAIAKESAKARDWCDWLIKQYVNHVAWLGEDGGYFEGPTYAHKMRYIMEALVPLRTATGLDVYRQPHVYNAGVYWLYAMSLNYWYEHWGDVYSLLMPWGNGSDTMLSALMAAMSDNRYVRWWSETVYASPNHVPMQYISETGIEARAPVDIAQARAFPDTGTVTAYDRFYDHLSPRIFFRSSPWGGQSHAHSDQNMFVIHAGGEILAGDVGYYTYYGDRYHTEYSRATVAHNTLLVGGKGQPRGGEQNGRIAAFFNSPECVYFAGRAASAYPDMLDRYDRHVLFLRPDVFLVFDDVEALVDEPVQWALNTFQKAEIDTKKRTITVPQQHMRLRVEHLQPASLRYSQSDGNRPAPLHDPAKPYCRVTPRFPQAWHIEAQPPPSPQPRFVSLMSVYEEAKGNPLRDTETIDAGGALGAKCTRGEDRYRLLVRRADSRAIDAAGVRTDGVAAMVRCDKGGRVASWMVADATRLDADTTAMLESKGGAFAATYDGSAARALFRAHPSQSGPVSLHLAEKPAQVLAFPAYEARQAQPIPFTWAAGQLVVNLAGDRETVVYADPRANPADMPATVQVQVRDGDEAWTATLETGVAEDGRWVAFGRLSPKTGGIYRFTCSDPSAEMLVQDHWDVRRTSRGTAPLEALWREGSEIFVHFTPASETPGIQVEVVRRANDDERNLLRNGDFEEWIPGYPPRGWYIKHKRDDAMAWPEWEMETPFEGKSCVRFVRPEKQMAICAQPAKLLHAGKYILRFATRGQATCGRVEIESESGANETRDIGPSAEWTRHEMPVELGRGLVHVRFRMAPGGPKDQVLWIDDARLIALD